MPRAPTSAASDAAPSPRQLWHAAQRLAVGDAVAFAAVQAGIRPPVLRALLDADDPDLLELIDACRTLDGLPQDARVERMVGLANDAAERELAAGNATVIAAVARASGCFQRRAAEGRDDASARLWRMLMTIGPDELVALQRGERFPDVASDPRFADDPLFAPARSFR